MRSSQLVLSMGFWLAAPFLALAAETPSFNKSAEKLQAATITVRVSVVSASLAPARPDAKNADAPSGEAANTASGAADSAKAESARIVSRVAVYSGVSLGKGLAVAPLGAAASSRIRITIPGGEQTEAKARVLDEYSGLALLALEKQDVAGIELAEGLPEVGSWVLSAAAWGVERPVVSLGIVSGADRTLRGGSFPPLLQADLRTAETSSGAGLVDQEGKLLGVVVAADSPDERRGWTYAVPASHIRRLLRALADKPEDKPVVVLQRRRPSVGMVLETEAERVVVRRVEKGSAAEKAGIRVGDRILSADGVTIRSAYQAVQPVLVRQPGDTLSYVVEQEGVAKTIEVVLGGGVAMPAAPTAGLAGLVPKIDLELVGKKNARAITPGGGVRELNFGPEARPAEAEPTLAESLKLLDEALERYRRVIEIQQGRLAAQNEERADSERQIEALKAKVDSLQKQLDALKK